MAHSRIDGLLIEDASISVSKLNFTPGDMLKTAYDSNDDGVVDAADAAAAVPWTGITGKPSEFASRETIVAVSSPTRFVNFSLGGGAYVNQALDGIDTALAKLWQTADTTVPDNSSSDVTLGLVAAVGAATVDYYIDRNGDYEIGSLLLITDETSNVEVLPLPLFQPTFNAGAPGVSFSGLIAAGNVDLRITTDASGDSAKVRLYWRSFATLA